MDERNARLRAMAIRAKELRKSYNISWQNALRVAAGQMKIEAGMRMLLARDQDYEEFLKDYRKENYLW